MVKLSPNQPCFCQSGKKYKKCCRPYLEGKQYPSTPETLVRARFVSYALRNNAFIMESTHPESPNFVKDEKRWNVQLDAYTLRNMFMDLEILSAEDDKVSYRARIVEFGTNIREYIEHANFKQEDGKWLYVDGEIVDVPKVSESEASE